MRAALGGAFVPFVNPSEHQGACGTATVTLKAPGRAWGPVALNPVLFVLAVLAAAFVPPVAYTIWVRNLEDHEREPWSGLSKAFGWGATGGVVVALVLHAVLGARPDAVAALGVSGAVFTAVIVAPVVEEVTKVLGLPWIDDPYVEPEDGLVYGAAAGFGFAATENLVYAASAYLDAGVTALATSLVVRSISSAFLHGAASALVGFGLWRRRAGVGDTGQLVGLYGVAVLVHAAYNLGASIQLWLGLLGSVALAWIVFTWVRRRVDALDARTAPGL